MYLYNVDPQGKESIERVARSIAESERQSGLYDIIPEDDVANYLKFGLVEVVYEWACGKVRYFTSRSKCVPNKSGYSFCSLYYTFHMWLISK